MPAAKRPGVRLLLGRGKLTPEQTRGLHDHVLDVSTPTRSFYVLVAISAFDEASWLPSQPAGEGDWLREGEP